MLFMTGSVRRHRDATVVGWWRRQQRERARHLAQCLQRDAGVGVLAMRSPKPVRPSVTWKKDRRAVQARFIRAQLAPSEAR